MPTRLVIFQRSSNPLQAIAETLQRSGVTIAVHDAVEAVFATLREVAVDMVLIDGDADQGLALLRMLKSGPKSVRRPVILATTPGPLSVSSEAIALGADDVWFLPLCEAELCVRYGALARVASMELELERRVATLAEFGAVFEEAQPGFPAISRTGIMLFGPASPEQVQTLNTLGGAVYAAYAEEPAAALERLRRQDIDIVIISTQSGPSDIEELCKSIREDLLLFDLPIILAIEPHALPQMDDALSWGVSELIVQPCRSEILRLRIQTWVRQQRLRRRLRKPAMDSVTASVLDHVTGLYGHSFVHTYLDDQIRHHSLRGEPLSVLAVTVRGLGAFNRRAGYAAGDRLLREAGLTIARSSRAEDLSARLGGDRFCTVLSKTTVHDAITTGRRLTDILARTTVMLSDGCLWHIHATTAAARMHPRDDALSLLRRVFIEGERAGLRRAS